ncbi:CdiA family toxin C-terminal domain-containing protein [Snodgrassella communis]|uniref:CdiA family toxin C-terminal domain-containing protein n=1 Tax=Snodgrassella communis TaxID=2946699 RepID=UPI002351ECCF|nr:CdiA family toxin C-terminal domain-containing protein [Snodgrassella communis]
MSGEHNADAFYSAVKQNGVKIVSETPTGIPGITEIKYQIPAKDRAGNIIGYKDKPLTKTIYDPTIVSDQKILDLGQQAAASGYKSAITSGAREYTSSAGGISFRIYLDPKTGTVTNFFPVTK